jgi:hypothetical protein
LGAWAFQKAVVIEELQPAQQLQLTSADKRDYLAGTQKAVPADEPDYGLVAVRQLHGGNGGSALEAGKAFIYHCATMTGRGENRETAELAITASFYFSNALLGICFLKIKHYGFMQQHGRRSIS